MMAKKEWEKIIHETYELLYINSTPPVSFKKLLKLAKIDSNGKKIIPFHDYKIDQKDEERILQSIRKKYNMSVQEYEDFQLNIILGCSPVYKSKPLNR